MGLGEPRGGIPPTAPGEGNPKLATAYDTRPGEAIRELSPLPRVTIESAASAPATVSRSGIHTDFTVLAKSMIAGKIPN